MILQKKVNINIPSVGSSNFGRLFGEGSIS